jgi:hypothetical protein
MLTCVQVAKLLVIPFVCGVEAVQTATSKPQQHSIATNCPIVCLLHCYLCCCYPSQQVAKPLEIPFNCQAEALWMRPATSQPHAATIYDFSCAGCHAAG